jgi:hypothetical protein
MGSRLVFALADQRRCLLLAIVRDDLAMELVGVCPILKR